MGMSSDEMCLYAPSLACIWCRQLWACRDVFADMNRVEAATQHALSEMPEAGCTAAHAVAISVASLAAQGVRNCITLGLRACSMAAASGPHREYPNSAVNELSSPCMQPVLAAMGLRALVRMLCGQLVFKALPNGCVWQLAGTPVDAALKAPPSPKLACDRTSGHYVIPHTRMFYRLSFSRQAGLPQRHPLLQAARAHFPVSPPAAAPGAAKATPLQHLMRASSIFMPGRQATVTSAGAFWPPPPAQGHLRRAPPTAYRQAGQAMLHSALQYAPDLPSSYVECLASALGHVAARVQSMPFARLLQEHCHLPPWLQAPVPSQPAAAAAALPRGKRVRQHTETPVHASKRPRAAVATAAGIPSDQPFPAGSLLHAFPGATPAALADGNALPPVAAVHAASDMQALMAVPDRRAEQVAPARNVEQPAALSSLPMDEQGRSCPSQCDLSQGQVMGFMRAVLLQLVPKRLRGGAGGTRFILRRLQGMLSSSRCDCLRVDTWLLPGCPTRAFQWAWPPGGVNAGAAVHAAALVRAWLLWLLVEVCVPLLAQCFYVTDSEQQHQTPLLFRKPVWLALRQHEMQRAQTRLGLQAVSVQGSSSTRAASSLPALPLGYAGMRLLPKRAGMRPIMNLSLAKDSKAAAPIKQAALLSVGRALQGGGAVAAARRMALSPALLPDALLTAVQGPSGAAAQHARSKGSLNQKLAALHDVLSCVRRAFPHRLGAAVLGMQGMHTAWRLFHNALRARRAVQRAEVPVYAVCVDVQSCFDSIHPDRLLGIVLPLLEQAGSTAGKLTLQHTYRIQKFAATTLSDRMGSASLPGQVQVKTRYQRSCPLNLASGTSTALPFAQVCAAAASSRHGAILTDMVRQTRLPSSLAAAQLIGHLKAHLVWTRRGIQQPPAAAGAATGTGPEAAAHAQLLGSTGAMTRPHSKQQLPQPRPRVFLQSKGIPQGSVLSTSLCNLYFGDMELQQVLPALAAAEQDCPEDPPALSALMRLTDDSLLLTTSKAVADAFCHCLHDPAGACVQEYKCVVNPSKTSTGSSHTPAACVMPWCGLLWNLATGAVAVDTQRSSDLGHLSQVTPITGNLAAAAALSASVYAVPAVRPIGFHADTSLVASLARQLAAYARPRLHPLLLDEATSGPDGVLFNLHCAFLLAWAKLRCALRKLPALALQLRRHCAQPRGSSEFLAVIQRTCTQFSLLISQLISGSMPAKAEGAAAGGAAATGAPPLPVHGLLLGGDAAHLLQLGGGLSSTEPLFSDAAAFRTGQGSWRQLGVASGRQRAAALGAYCAVPRSLVAWLAARAAACVWRSRLPRGSALLQRLQQCPPAAALQRATAQGWAPGRGVDELLAALQRAEAHLNSIKY